MVRIVFQRSGGFAGLPAPAQSLEIDSRQLQPDRARELERLVGDAALAGQPVPGKAAAAVRDGFQYHLRVEDDSRTDELVLSDGAIPAKLLPLVRWLSREVDARLREALRKREETEPG
ncbi:MAG TPA: protealysin inhibitor emfourin [Thermoanaerobaculia bacterium]|nr:protealysin inhibitor emfourin [Thermoanaerobaculia bacterium]